MIKWLTRLFTSHANAVPTTIATGLASTTRSDTEFSAEIVIITSVIPHPNADRLEICRFEMKGLGETTYEVVTKKGEFQSGQLAGYFSVDCILPLEHPAFAFLSSRLDGVGKTHYRLRAARLRGVFSQGLLVPLEKLAAASAAVDLSRWTFELGTDISNWVGVTYYSPTVKGSSLAGDNRNDSRLNRNQPQPAPIYTVDSLKKLPRLFEPGEMVHITEKIHGTNFRFGWVRRKILGVLPWGWKFVVGSHRVMKGDNKTGHYYGTDLWQQAADHMKLEERTRDYKGFVFYGELFGYTYSGEPIQDLTYGRLIATGPALAVFDIRDVESKSWLSPGRRGFILADIDLPGVPVIDTAVEWDLALLELAEGKSMLDKKTVREGIVVEAMTAPRRKAKFVSNGYLLRKDA